MFPWFCVAAEAWKPRVATVNSAYLVRLDAACALTTVRSHPSAEGQALSEINSNPHSLHVASHKLHRIHWSCKMTLPVSLASNQMWYKWHFYPLHVKGHVTLHFKMDIAPDVHSAVYPSEVFAWAAGFWRYWYVMKVDNTSLGGLEVPTKWIWKTQLWCLFPEIVTLLVNMIHMACCEQFHGGTIFLVASSFLIFCWTTLYQCAKGNIHLLKNKRLMGDARMNLRMNGPSAELVTLVS